MAEALAREALELERLARRLMAHAPFTTDALLNATDEHARRFAHADDAYAAEAVLEDFTRALRSIWLRAAAAETSLSYRSPTDEDAARVERRHDSFGYERDLQPTALEARCDAFFPRPPAGWRSEHILFSSGQAALAAALITLQAGGSRGVAHEGCYFETRSLLEDCVATNSACSVTDADIVMIEALSCDGSFIQRDVPALMQQLRDAPRQRTLIFDSTLTGRADGINTALCKAPPDALVLRVSSGLKLMQAGLELANVGILSVFAHTQMQAEDIAARLRRTRTLIGLGLRFADVLALEAPFFLDADYATQYEDAVFANNAALARAVNAVNARFLPISHPALDTPTAPAPYCVFRLPNNDGYDALEEEIAREAAARRIHLDHGGSFGFRGHRFEVVRPETGEPPFLRVAMGRRGGASCEGVITLMCDLASR